MYKEHRVFQSQATALEDLCRWFVSLGLASKPHLIGPQFTASQVPSPWPKISPARAASNNEAAFRSVSSSQRFTINCMPTGSFVSTPPVSGAAEPQGTLMAGWPVTLNGQVFAVLPMERLSLSITPDPSPSV